MGARRHVLRWPRNIALVMLATVFGALAPAAPAVADKPSVVTETFQFPDVNPCTGEPHVVTATVTMRLHEHGDRIVSHNEWFVTSSDGFIGGGPEQLVVNGQIVNFPLNVMMTNPETGAKFRVHLVEVFDLATETFKVQRLVFSCVSEGRG